MYQFVGEYAFANSGVLNFEAVNNILIKKNAFQKCSMNKFYIHGITTFEADVFLNSIIQRLILGEIHSDNSIFNKAKVYKFWIDDEFISNAFLTEIKPFTVIMNEKSKYLYLLYEGYDVIIT